MGINPTSACLSQAEEAFLQALLGKKDNCGKASRRKLPPAERAAAMAALTRDLPPEYREAIERYFKRLAQTEMMGK